MTLPLRRVLAAGGALALVAVLASPGVADPLPVDEPFSGTTFADPAWVLPGGDANSATLSGDALRLTTPSPGFQVANATLDDPFRSDVAFTMDFDYGAYGGGNPGDAMTVFLMNGSQPPELGGSGGSAGYFGMQGAYLAIGLDNAGNFGADNQFPNTPNTVTLRGASSAAPDPWPVLADTPVPGGTVQTTAGSPRHVQVVVEPDGADGNLVTVRVAAVAGGPLTTVYDRVDVRGLGRGQPVRPAQFRIGFSAATGGATNTYEVSDLVVTADVDLAVAKTGPATVYPGREVSWQVEATNDATNPVSDAVVTDTVPVGVEDATWECTSASAAVCPVPATGAAAGGVVTVPLALLRDDAATITITGTATDALAGSSITNTAAITAASRTELTPTDNEDSWTTRVRALPDLAPTVTVDQALLEPTGPVSWTVDVANLAAADGDAPDAAVSVTVPPVVDRTTLTPPAGCTPSPAGFLCSLGPLAAGGTATLAFAGTAVGDVDVCTAGDSTFTATASTSSTDADPDNDVDSVAVPCTVPVDLSITKTAPDEAALGDGLVYTVVASNAGPNAAPGTVVDDELPGALRDATWTCTVSDGSSCSPASGAGDVDAVVMTVPEGGAATVVVRGTVGDASFIDNTATVTPCASCTDADLADNAASVRTRVSTVVTPPTPTPSASDPSPSSSATPTPSPTDDGGLALTGSDAATPLVWALVLVAAGLVVLLVSRRSTSSR
ncbi:DUF11 domain-containing protein [Cellulomonas sp. PhB150]|uniref:lectin-like domain-containing protein n=1 Tax=Cellulomonas sp. PhB150 TaxID=2485188 RepID=UPI000F4957D0|nr:DUF11 domain-containing protein [Cellulomonas sp. PhB150]ROS31553.1 putative repeat protein (TIGR01451 family) [Cellulomonas sp. PhB150]